MEVNLVKIFVVLSVNYLWMKKGIYFFFTCYVENSHTVQYKTKSKQKQNKDKSSKFLII